MKTKSRFLILTKQIDRLAMPTGIGLGVGALSAFFLFTLDWVTRTREANSSLIWFLPIAAFAVALVYNVLGHVAGHASGRNVERGTNLVLDEIHSPKSVVPLRMIPLILIGTWITHLFGGSAGREGTAVQMGASFADQMAHRSNSLASASSDSRSEKRTTYLMCGMAAGFGSVFGVPFAGLIFGLEVLSIGRLRFKRLLECAVSSFVGHFTVLSLGVHHTSYTRPLIESTTPKLVVSVIVAGLLFGLAAKAFSLAMTLMGRALKSVISYSPARALIGGALVVGGFLLLGDHGAFNTRYAGLGIDVIQESLRQPLAATDFFYKSIFTVLTLASGLKGGEVTPLLFIGSTLGNALSQLLPIHFSLLAALGFVGVFAGAANTPLACTLMAMEIFGASIGPYALVVCYLSYLASGHHGIYSSQKIERRKPLSRLISKIRGS